MSFFTQNKSSFAASSQGQARPSFLSKASGGKTVAVDQEFKAPSLSSLSIGSNSFLRERNTRDSINSPNNNTFRSDISRTHYNQNDGDDSEDNCSVSSEREFELGNDLVEQNWVPQQPCIGQSDYGATHGKLTKMDSETFVQSSNLHQNDQNPKMFRNHNGQMDEKLSEEKYDTQDQMGKCNEEDMEYSDNLGSKNQTPDQMEVAAPLEEKNTVRFSVVSTFLHKPTDSPQLTIADENHNSNRNNDTDNRIESSNNTQPNIRRISNTLPPSTSDTGFGFATPTKWTPNAQLNTGLIRMEKNAARSSLRNNFTERETPKKDQVPFLFNRDKSNVPSKQVENISEVNKRTPNNQLAMAVTSELAGTTAERQPTFNPSVKSNTNRFSPTPYSTSTNIGLIKTPSSLSTLFKKPNIPFSQAAATITTANSTPKETLNYHSAVSPTTTTFTTTTPNNNNSSDNNDRNEMHITNSSANTINASVISTNNRNPVEITSGHFLPALLSPPTPNTAKKRKQTCDDLRYHFYEESKLQQYSYENKNNSYPCNNNTSKSMEEYLTSILEKNEIKKELRKQKESLQSQRLSLVSETARLLQHDALPVATKMLLDCLQKVSDIR